MPYLKIFIPKQLEDADESLRRDIAGADHAVDKRRYVKAIADRKEIWGQLEVERESS